MPPAIAERGIWPNFCRARLVEQRFGDVFREDAASGGAIALQGFALAVVEGGLLEPSRAATYLDTADSLLSRVADASVRVHLSGRLALARAQLIDAMPDGSIDVLSRGMAAVQTALASGARTSITVMAALVGANLLERAGRPHAALAMLERGRDLPDVSESDRSVFEARASLLGAKHGLRAGPSVTNPFGQLLSRNVRMGSSLFAEFDSVMTRLGASHPDAHGALQRVMRLLELGFLQGADLDRAVDALEDGGVGADPWCDRTLAMARVRQRMRVEPREALSQFERLFRQEGPDPEERLQMLTTVLLAWLEAPEAPRRGQEARILDFHGEVVALLCHVLERATVSAHARRSQRAYLDPFLSVLGMAYAHLAGMAATEPGAASACFAYWQVYLVALVAPQIEAGPDDPTLRSALRALLTEHVEGPGLFEGPDCKDAGGRLDAFEMAWLQRAGAENLRTAWNTRAPTALETKGVGLVVTVQAVEYNDFAAVFFLLVTAGQYRFFVLPRGAKRDSLAARRAAEEMREALGECDRWLVLPDGEVVADGLEEVLGYSSDPMPPALRVGIGMALRRPLPWRKPASVLFVGGARRLGRYPPLAEVPDERERVRAACERHGAAFECLEGADATPEAFRARWSRGAFDVIHVACHGDAATFEETAYLVLSPGQDGALVTALDMVACPSPRPVLVVLSACWSSKAWRYRGAATHGLAQAFLEAGASHVIAARRPVVDRHAAMLTPAFVALALSGEPPDRALWLARRDFPECDPDFAWACYEMM